MAFRPSKTYVIAMTSSASAAQALTATGLTSGDDSRMRQIQVTGDVAVIVKFGDNAVAADRTVTSNALADGNFYQPAGVPMLYDLTGAQTHISGILASGSTAGSLYVTVGIGEDI